MNNKIDFNYNFKTSFKVFKIFAANIGFLENFNFSGGKNSKNGISGSKNAEKGKKIGKNIFLSLLFIYCFGLFFFIYASTMNNIYIIYEAMGKTELMPVAALFSAFVMTLFFGFASVASNYYTGNGEEYFMSLPLRPLNIFFGKFGVSFITDAFYGFAIVCIAGVIYGIHQNLLSKPFFYVGIIISGITIPLIAVFLIYLLFIIFLTIFKGLRKKNILSAVSTVFIMIFALGYGFFGGGYGTKIGYNAGSGADNLTNLQNDSQMMNLSGNLGSISEKIPFLQMISKAFAGNILSILAEIAVCVFIIFVLLPVLSPAYIKTLDGFSDVKTKKLNVEKAGSVLKKESKSKSILNALFWRDIKTMFREPAFFSNGPLLVLLIPLILIFSIGIGFHSQLADISIGQLRNNLAQMVNSFMISPEKTQLLIFYASLIFGGISIFVGNGSNAAATSFSREGKALYDLKAMPIDYNTLILAKFLHALVYPLLCGVIMSILVEGINVFLFNVLGFSEIINIILMILVVTAALSLPQIFFGMLIDTVNPKLEWENPLAAFKQNFNSLFSVLFDLICIAIFVVLSLKILPKNQNGIMLLCWISVVFSVPFGRLYWKYAVKKIPLM